MKNEIAQVSKMISFLLSLFVFPFLFCLISGCAPIARPALDSPLSFEVAVRMASYDLFAQVSNQLEFIDKQNKFVFLTDKIINADTGDEINLNAKISDIIAATARENFPNFSVLALNSDNVGQANFVIIGVVKQEVYSNGQAKFPHLLLSIVDMKTSVVKAHSEVWISNQNFEMQATPLFADSPMYIKDARVSALIATAKAAAGASADKEYFNALSTTAVLAEASEAYDAGNYTLAVGLFGKAADRADGLTMKTFAGLYQSFFKLGRMQEAENAFAKLAEVGIKSGNLSVKFLFKVNDTDFFGDPQELIEYQIWLRQIANEIARSASCFDIVGHASRSGSADYNIKLSQKRADKIREKLQKTAEGIKMRTNAFGKGFEENIVGTGTNDVRDAIDRRVEFKVQQCK